MNIEMKYVYLKSHPLFANVSEETLQAASSMAKVQTVYRGESFNYGDSSYSKIFLLIKGKTKIAEINESGHELIKDILTAPDIFGDLGLDGQVAMDEYAEALTSNTIVCSFSVTDFRKILESKPIVALAYANMVNAKLRRVENRHSDLVFHDAKSRLIRFIKNWAQTDGTRNGNKIVLNNYLTHTDIANVIATSRQSVNVLLNELRDSGMLFYNRKEIELTNIQNWN